MAGKEAGTPREPRTARVKQRQEQNEGQQLPNVWNFLQQKVNLHNPDVIKSARESNIWWRVVSKVWALATLLEFSAVKIMA